MLEKYLNMCGLDGKGYSIHKLRHTAATLMYQNDVDVLQLKEILGHENLSTTQIYTHVLDSQLRAAVEQNPLANVRADTEDLDESDDEAARIAYLKSQIFPKGDRPANSQTDVDEEEQARFLKSVIFPKGEPKL